MRGRADTGVADGELSRLRSRQRREFLHGLRRHRVVDNKDDRHLDRKRDRREVAHRIVRQRRVEARIDGDRVARHQQRVAVGRRLDGTLDRDVAAAAGRILDHDRLAPACGELLGKQSRRNVRRARRAETRPKSGSFVPDSFPAQLQMPPERAPATRRQDATTPSFGALHMLPATLSLPHPHQQAAVAKSPEFI